MLINLNKNNKYVFVILLFLFASCAEKEEVNYVVKVGDSYLTEENIAEYLNSKRYVNKFREEFIREWIEKELIYLDAVEKGILNSDEFNEIINTSRIEIANALVIKQMISEKAFKTTKKELEDFYLNNIAKFKVVTPILVFNQVSFSERAFAEEFLEILIKSNWANAINNFADQKSKISIKGNRNEYVYNILNEDLKNEIEMLSENEFSRIIEISSNNFVIVQLIKRHNKNELPEFEDIKEEVEQKYLSLKRKELYDNYLIKLYSEYSSVIVR